MTRHSQSRYNQRQGIAALLTVVIIGAATLVIASGAALLGLGELDAGYTSARGAEAFSIADGCLEEMLEQVRRNPAYGPDGALINLTVPNGSCVVKFKATGQAFDRDIWVTGTTATGNYNKRIRATLTLTGNVIAITLWEERND